MEEVMDYKNGDKLSLSNYWVGLLAFSVASILGVYQVLEYADMLPQSAKLYFASVSTCSVLMGFVLTTFVIMGFGYFTACCSLKYPLWHVKLVCHCNVNFRWIGGAINAAYSMNVMVHNNNGGLQGISI